MSGGVLLAKLSKMYRAVMPKEIKEVAVPLYAI